VATVRALAATPDTRRGAADLPTVAGTSLGIAEATVSKSRQKRMLAACDVDAASLGAHADASLLGIDCMLAVRKSKVRAPDKLIHLEQRIEVHTPFAVDEKLGVRAKIDQVEQTPGGEKARATFDFLGRDGAVVAQATATTLVAEPSWLREAPAFRGDPRAGHKLVARKLLNSVKVQAYSEESGNRLHFDPAYAVRHGLRAPVANALMTLTWALEACRAAKATTGAFALTARFQSPLFWDDGVDVLVREELGTIAAVRCVSSAGALVCEAELG
jgi:hypothetical protein